MDDQVSYTPALRNAQESADELVNQYFHLGYTNKQICGSLILSHHIIKTPGQVKKILQRQGLRRRHGHQYVESPLHDIIKAITSEVEGSGSCLGYRAMWKRLKGRKYNLKVRRDTVMEILRVVDPEGTERRKRHRLMKRNYMNPGPNFMWHIDGYDKLKPFGFPIHGAIDGYSRRIIWLEVDSSNNNPDFIASYYLKAVNSLKLIPRVIRADMGTENVSVENLQTSLRSDFDAALPGLNSFMYGKSTSNQRIEAWWGILRRQGADWWIAFFKDLVSCGLYEDSNPLHLECIRFCFRDIIQKELDLVAKEWNLHHISTKHSSECPSGKPDILYFLPYLSDTVDYGLPVDVEEIDACLQLFDHEKPARGCSDEFLELVELLCNGIPEPTNAEDALRLYMHILECITEYV